MKAQRHKRLAPLAALAALGAMGAMAPGLSAQEGPFSYDFKIRGGLFGGDLQEAHYDNKVMGLGLQAKRALGAGQAVSVELTYEHVTGRHRDITDWGKFRWGQEWGSNGTNLGPSPDNNPLNLHPWDSFDDRKEASQGFSLLCAWHSKLPPILGQDGFEWFAGIRLDRHKVYSEFKWSMYDRTAPGYWPANPTQANLPGNPDLIFLDADHFSEEGAAFVPGAFGGVKWQFNENMGFEMGLRYFGMKHYDFTAGPYFGVNDEGRAGGELKTGTKYGYSIEFAISCRI